MCMHAEGGVAMHAYGGEGEPGKHMKGGGELNIHAVGAITVHAYGGNSSPWLHAPAHLPHPGMSIHNSLCITQ